MIFRCLLGAVMGGVFWLAVGILLLDGLSPLLFPGSLPAALVGPGLVLYGGSWLLFGGAFGAYVVYRNFPPEP